MPKRTVTVYSDDFDGTDLPEDTKPISLSIGSKRYALYLSAENEGKLYDALEPFIKNAEVAYDHKVVKAAETAASTLPRGAKSGYAKAKADQMDTLREWAKSQSIDLPAKGAPKNELVDSFYEAHESLPRLIGRNTISIEDWQALGA